MGRIPPVVWGFVLVVAVLAGIALTRSDAPPAKGPDVTRAAPIASIAQVAPVASIDTRSIASNILPGDYVGPKSCEVCHDKQYTGWRAHPHSRMNQNASAATVRGDFSGIVLAYGEGLVTFGRDGDSFTMTLEKAGKLVRRYRVTRSVGSRFMQFYVGLQTEGPEARETLAYQEEHKLPFGYWFKLKRWLPVSYFDPVGAETKPDGTPTYDPFDNPRVHVWRQNCMLCHNTVPYLYRIALPDGLSGFPLTDMPIAIPQLRAEMGRGIDLTPKPGIPISIKERIEPEKNLVTLGISCEACHFGGREHAACDINEGTPHPRFLPTNRFVKVSPPDRKIHVESSKENAYATNHICAECHCATITLYPNGAGTWNSREATDMLGGACASEIKCTDCHDPHSAGGPEARPLAEENVAACVRCHPKYKESRAARAHGRHPDAVTCLDCHMPRTTQGLEEVVVTHHISSPTDVRMLAAGSWNSCNICHLDKPIAWTLDELAKGWGKKITPTADWVAYRESVGLTWLKGADPSMRLVATQAYARSPLGKSAFRELLAALDDPVGVNRVFASFAVERVRGRALGPDEIDLTARHEVRSKQIAAIAGP